MTIPETMTAVLLTGYGGLDMLELRQDVPTPKPQAGEVLIQVAAAGVNNTDVNARIGWYSDDVTDGTDAGGDSGLGVSEDGMGDWSGDVAFPRIQGADVVGRIVAVGDGVASGRIGERVLCCPVICVEAEDDDARLDSAQYLGAERDGGFAQFCALPAANAFPLSDGLTLSDAVLATAPCSGGTATNMALMAEVGPGRRVLVTGASGGVGSFLVQVCKALGAEVVAVAGASKADAVRALGADAVIDRAAAPPDYRAAAMGAASGGRFSVVADIVGGELFGDHLDLLRRGGRYVTAGAIAGPLVTLDLRTLYLKNLRFHGSTVFRRDTFPTLVRLLEAGAVTPALAATYPLAEITAAQTAFLEKRHVGSLALIPPPVAGT